MDNAVEEFTAPQEPLSSVDYLSTVAIEQFKPVPTDSNYNEAAADQVQGTDVSRRDPPAVAGTAELNPAGRGVAHLEHARGN